MRLPLCCFRTRKPTGTLPRKLVLRLVLAVLASGCVHASTNITELIEQLNASAFAERETADTALRELGRRALPEIKAAERDPAPEIRVRARAIRRDLFDAEIRRGFEALGQLENDADINLERGMWLIARLVEPELEQAPIEREFDRLAELLRLEFVRRGFDLGRKGAPGKTKPGTVPANTIVAALQSVLFKKEGFTGAPSKTYEHPDNSAIHRVLNNKHGLPILLSHVVVAVSERLDLPVYGIQVPGRYMVKVIGPTESIIINPFEDAKIESVVDLQRTRFVDPERHLLPSPHRDTLTRMMRNLIYHFDAVDEPKKAAKATEMLGLLE